MATKRPKHGRTVTVDAAKMATAMNHRGVTVEELADAADCSVGTVNNLLAGKPAYRKTVVSVAKSLELPLAVLLGESDSDLAVSTLHEYLVSDVLTDWMTASNGLKYQICRLRHLELDRQARGKRFDLRDLPTDEQQRCRTWIKRHPNVCDAIGNHANIARNITAFHDPLESYYWVIDEWVDGQGLWRKLKAEPLAVTTVQQLMLDMANGLSALHGQGIVCRELNPGSVLIRNGTGQAVLTDFELAKLIDRGPTVSTSEWPVDPYRAGEAESDDVDLRADIYSWARIGVHALLGELPEIGSEQVALEKVNLPKQVRSMISQSCAVFRSDRPSSFAEILNVLKGWS